MLKKNDDAGFFALPARPRQGARVLGVAACFVRITMNLQDARARRFRLYRLQLISTTSYQRSAGMMALLSFSLDPHLFSRAHGCKTLRTAKNLQGPGEMFSSNPFRSRSNCFTVRTRRILELSSRQHANQRFQNV